MTCARFQGSWICALSLVAGLVVCSCPVQAGLFGLCQLIASFDNPDIGYYYGIGPYGGGGSVYVWGPPDYGTAQFRSQWISQFGLDRNFRQQEVISDRLWEEARRSTYLATKRSRDYQQNWMRRMTGVPPGWAVRPTRQTRLETREPVRPVITGGLDWRDGQIQWPNLLAMSYFADLRGAIETDFAAVCKSQTGSQVDRVRLLESIDLLRQELKGIGDQVRAHQFLVSLRFLDRFESEIQSR